MEQLTMIQAIRKYLVINEATGQPEPLSKLSTMYKQLTDQDKQDLTKDFLAIGVEITAPSKG